MINGLNAINGINTGYADGKYNINKLKDVTKRLLHFSDNRPKMYPRLDDTPEYKFSHEKDMLCHDESGKTADIAGHADFDMTQAGYPSNIYIVDNSSGKNNVYHYEFEAMHDDGKPVYKCVEINGAATKRSNQYTLEQDKDGYAMLVQHESQPNYGIGIQSVLNIFS